MRIQLVSVEYTHARVHENYKFLLLHENLDISGICMKLFSGKINNPLEQYARYYPTRPLKCDILALLLRCAASVVDRLEI